MATTQKIETIIDGSLDKDFIKKAIDAYIDTLYEMATPKSLAKSLDIQGDMKIFQERFLSRIHEVGSQISNIVYEINTRAKMFLSDEYLDLVKKDRSLWEIAGKKSPLFGVLACVDKGVPAEAVVGPEVSGLGRLLAGDIRLSYIRSTNSFIPIANAIIKRFIHYGRQGNSFLVEPLIEHTSCGRRGQILANEHGHGEIPSLGFIFDHAEALVQKPEESQKIKSLWLSWKCSGTSVITPDKGLYAGIVQKMAQRQALASLHEDISIISPIEVYEKETGNLYTGLDKSSVLTDDMVLKAGGYTAEILADFSKSKKIFSLASHSASVFDEIFQESGINRGSKTFDDLQKDWLKVQEDLVTVTESLWNKYKSSNAIVSQMVSEYFDAWKGSAPNNDQPEDTLVIHHLFHITAYAYIFDTFVKGHVPGVQHIEHYLATGDHEIGMKKYIPLGQGDLDRPSASEMFTGYSVLLHSKPGHDGTPIPAIIKLDTDRSGDLPMSTEETNVAIDDLREFFKLWPYFLVGDIVPILMVRGKQLGGISRLGLSVLRSFGDMTILLEQTPSPLPNFVPANTSKGEVVMVPARDVILTGIKSKTLNEFRNTMTNVADQYENPVVQTAFLNR